MKPVFFLLTVLFSLLSLNAYAGAADVRITSIGCVNGEGTKACWVNLDPDRDAFPGVPDQCAGHFQVRWHVQLANGENTGPELYAMALMAFTNDFKLRISVDELNCFSPNSNSPLVEWMSIIE